MKFEIKLASTGIDKEATLYVNCEKIARETNGTAEKSSEYITYQRFEARCPYNYV